MSEKNPWFEPGEPARPTDIKSDKADLDMRLERKALAEGWDRTADKLDEALSQLAALREELKKERKELGKQRGLKNSMVLHCQDLDQRLADAERRNAALDIESAAKVLANCMDYPWENMPENGRVLMRKHAQHVIDAALTKPEEAKS